MVRHYGGLGVESGGYLSPSVSLSLYNSLSLHKSSVCMRAEKTGVTFIPSFLLCVCVCVCVSERRDGSPHGCEGGTVKRGALSDPERSASRCQGQGSPYVPFEFRQNNPLK